MDSRYLYKCNPKRCQTNIYQYIGYLQSDNKISYGQPIQIDREHKADDIWAFGTAMEFLQNDLTELMKVNRTRSGCEVNFLARNGVNYNIRITCIFDQGIRVGAGIQMCHVCIYMVLIGYIWSQ